MIIINKNKNFDLYSIENLKINLSAIVGKNGSGKSAISELIYMAINNLYIHCLNKDESDYIDYVKVNGLNVELYFESYGIYKITFSGQNVTGFEYHKIDENDNEYKYKIDSVPFEINKEFLEKLFYTVSVNYSLHGLNSKNHEDWLESLFIKNDGYENPIVFEPNREEGIINIHKQEELLRLRFISNIIELVENEIISEDEKTNAKEENDTDKKWIFESTRIGESSEISIISLKISNKKTDVIYKKKDKSIIEFKDDLLSYKNIIDALKENFDFRNVDISTIDFDNKENNQSIALRYIVKKIIKIAETYSPYREIFWDNQLEEIRNIPTFINKLSKDPTHVTNKVYQAVNYLAGIIKYQNKDYDIKSIVKLITTSKVEYNNSDTGNLKTIHLIPPPFFENKILVRDINKLGNNTFLFELLSSGERQQIYSVHSIR
ncbi:MAG: hypothetical protein IPO21_19255 [Bacteroidales bacterium]|nr:hypothetical protein [Bacteroidales bacterium]